MSQEAILILIISRINKIFESILDEAKVLKEKIKKYKEMPGKYDDVKPKYMDIKITQEEQEKSPMTLAFEKIKEKYKTRNSSIQNKRYTNKPKTNETSNINLDLPEINRRKSASPEISTRMKISDLKDKFDTSQDLTGFSKMTTDINKHAKFKVKLWYY